MISEPQSILTVHQKLETHSCIFLLNRSTVLEIFIVGDTHKGMQNFEPPPVHCGGNEEPLPQSSPPTPATMDSSKCQWQSEEQSRENLSSTTQPVPILQQLPNWDKLGSPVLKMPAPESTVSYAMILQDSCTSGAAIWRTWIKNKAVNYPPPKGQQTCMLLVNIKTAQGLLYFPLPPPLLISFFFFSSPPYLIPFVYSVSYLRQWLSLPMCLCSALHEGWQL